MKQTNYYLFDFLDFDPVLQQDEYLWKSYCPRSVASTLPCNRMSTFGNLIVPEV